LSGGIEAGDAGLSVLLDATLFGLIQQLTVDC
jgi:hypothetical protein